ncbi:DedA family protein [bacterium]|jgi:membrane protein DedA with SNARE-associated domain|nr:DedA family protein [bacterium]
MDFNLIVDFLIDYYGPIPYAAIFVILLACGLGVPIPEDITLIAGGILTYYGVCDVWLMIAVGLVGVLLGDSIMYFLGHRFGRKLLKRWPFRMLLDEKRIDSIRGKLHKHGAKLLFSARFMPGVRSTVFFASGVLHYPYRKMLIYDGAAAILSVPAIVYSVYYFGDFLESVIRYIKKAEAGIIAVIVLVLVAAGFRFWSKRRAQRKGFH